MFSCESFSSSALTAAGLDEVGPIPELIAFADTHAGHGNFRPWSKITAHAVTGLRRLDRSRPDRDVLQGVCSRLGGRRN